MPKKEVFWKLEVGSFLLLQKLPNQRNKYISFLFLFFSYRTDQPETIIGWHNITRFNAKRIIKEKHQPIDQRLPGCALVYGIVLNIA